MEQCTHRTHLRGVGRGVHVVQGDRGGTFCCCGCIRMTCEKHVLVECAVCCVHDVCDTCTCMCVLEGDMVPGFVNTSSTIS